jgi:two-component system, LytTR family, sensor kinase
LSTKINVFKKIFQKDSYKFKDLLIISIVFSLLAIIGTYSGVNVEGAIANTRTVAIMSGGILFGPVVGIISGVVAGFHRYIIDMNGVTSLPCLISSIVTGIASGIVYKKSPKEHKWVHGILAGIICENLTMMLILIMSKPFDLSLYIVKQIYFPMIVGQIGVGVVVLLMHSIQNEKEEIAARQAKLSLDIANKTLPYFRNINEDSLMKICNIIKDEINADAVSITDKNHVLAYVGIGEEHYSEEKEIVTDSTKQAIETGEIINIQTKNEEYFHNKEMPLKSAMIIPLKEKNEITGTLKIYYCNRNQMTYSQQNLAIGLSQMISTLMEIAKIEQIKEMANKAEIKALQSQINPHFLFNALNTITSFIRIDPENARELIIDLSTYLRYNLESNEKLIDISKELEQVKAYVAIEKARFNDKLNIIYDIEEGIISKIPSLIIQPLVENAIIHGILKHKGRGSVKISVKKIDEKNTRISIQDDGIGISDDIIEKVYNGTMPENKIGLYNVHLRLKLIYGSGLKIYKNDKGTNIEFVI